MPLAARLPKNGVFGAGAGMLGLATAWLVTIGSTVATAPIDVRIPWIPQLGLSLDFRIDVLSWVLALIVTGIGAVVFAYCIRYFEPDAAGRGRFAAVLLAFAAAMLALVTADNIYLMFIAWEATSILSFLLIGHYSARRASRAAAMQALLVTTLGGLVMFIGLIVLHAAEGTARLSELIASPIAPTGITITAALLILVGAASKSALVPFHFWLPGAMAAPTPVSAYLHAASMVKADVYLVLRLMPGIAELPGVRESLIVVGIVTMLVGGWRSLRQTDLKLVLAFGTVSQLGFLMTIAGFGTRDALLAALALLIAHALFKAALFLVVGLIDHVCGTRDLRKLSGLGRRAPLLATVAAIAGAAMAGLPPLWGFVAKESVFGAFVAAAEHGDAWGTVAAIGTTIGSALTVAYTLRFWVGAFGTRPGVTAEIDEADLAHMRPALAAPALLSVGLLALPFAAGPVDRILADYADTLRTGAGEPLHLALWHGFGTPLWLSLASLGLGALLWFGRRTVALVQDAVPPLVDAARGYAWSLRSLDAVATRVTATTQRGSLPGYLGTILFVLTVTVAVMVGGMALNASGNLALRLEPDLDWRNAAVFCVMAAASIAIVRARKRFEAMVLVGVIGYSMSLVFALGGAPDLATTQALIETITLIVFVLVLRRLPARHTEQTANRPLLVRAAIGTAAALAIGALALVAMGNRIAPSDGLAFPDLAVVGGHGENFVNVTLVDIRGWDTFGELSVLLAAATGIASLVFVSRRSVERTRPEGGTRRRTRLRELRDEGLVVPRRPASVVTGANATADETADERVWLLAGHTIAPEHRSIVVEVIVRLVFHALIIASLFLLFSGHNVPGGGFAGGAVAGAALAARYFAGGRHELDEAIRVDTGRLLGVGMLLAAGTVITPMLFGLPPFTSAWIDTDLGWIGHLVVVSSTVFDIGVYLIVIGLVLDILRTLGAELDTRETDPDAPDLALGSIVLDADELGEQARIPEPPVTRRLNLTMLRRRPRRKRGERDGD